MIKSSKMIADIEDGYTIERTMLGDWHLKGDGKSIHLGDDKAAAEVAKDLAKLVAMWGDK